jgi:hypothetical protein
MATIGVNLVATRIRESTVTSKRAGGGHPRRSEDPDGGNVRRGCAGALVALPSGL